VTSSLHHQVRNLPNIEALNSECYCLSLDEAALRLALESELGTPGLAELLEERCPYLFSARPVFITAEHLARMAQVIEAVEGVVVLPSWRERVLSHAPDIARLDPGGAKGVFFGYDFHLTEQGFGLIEINTNAGGAMLNAVLARAQIACCPPMQTLLPPMALTAQLEAAIIEMFRREWSLAGHTRALCSIAIIDEAPEEQYLYPEFLLFRQLFLRHGLQAVIATPQEFELREGSLWHGDLQIDLIYNRLTDFMLNQPYSAAIRQAYSQQAVVLTPHPQAHALYADKRNLALLTDRDALQSMQVPEATQEILLAGIPHTEVVDPANAERLWAGRKQLFFKPAAGYGSRAAYRGDKLTTRVWQDILKAEYVAQKLVVPGERLVTDEPARQKLKFDVRNYVYEGAVQWVAARLYQGQTTNFRTPHGGFAPVYSYAATTPAPRPAQSPPRPLARFP
jgi:hypothetical protein